jgi:8-oxo-dGTP diphosphatase
MMEVVAALIWQGDKFMICQRPAHKARGLLWEFVGGKVEPGETKEQALIRECREELAVTHWRSGMCSWTSSMNIPT